MVLSLGTIGSSPWWATEWGSLELIQVPPSDPVKWSLVECRGVELGPVHPRRQRYGLRPQRGIMEDGRKLHIRDGPWSPHESEIPNSQNTPRRLCKQGAQTRVHGGEPPYKESDQT